MAKTPAKNLTVKYLEALERKVRAGEKVTEWHPDGDGLYLRVLPSGRMSFELRRRPFKPLLIGHYDMGLPTARKKAAEARAQQAAGADPALAKAEAKRIKSETFGAVMDKFIERHAKPHMKSWSEVVRGLNYDALPKWKDTPICACRTTSSSHTSIEPGRKLGNWWLRVRQPNKSNHGVAH